ncbi:conserved hypothetical protein [Zunongwangia profunda SM-A87]|uniref:Type IX secretion system membrane protein PorP/SprF n=2 Tax=Flavobacteriaceae TaxID=49546 RepID=D5BHJ7_ZUNPS|nr:conserved hypothetical protein [Zunongwangia profunda SM-A87]
MLTKEVIAQQDPHYTQYMFNTMSINPAYAGSTGSLQALLLYRSQWVGVDGAPETQNFSMHSPLRNEKMGLGLNIVNDKLGPSSEVFADANFSYTIQTGYYTKLAFGVKGGARVLNVDWSKGRFYDPEDVLLNNNIDSRIMPSLGAGAYWYSDRWYIGASIPNFIRSDYYDDIQEAVLSNRLHYFIMGGYVFDINRNLKLKPAFLVKAVSGAPVSVDVSANFLLQEFLNLGAAYRWNDSVSLLAGFQISRSLFVGYSYDYTTTDFTKYNDGTHEILLRFDLLKGNNKIKSPRFF